MQEKKHRVVTAFVCLSCLSLACGEGEYNDPLNPFVIRNASGAVVQQLDPDLIVAIEEELVAAGRSDDADRLIATYDVRTGLIREGQADQYRAFLPGDLRYRAHVHKAGWLGVVQAGEIAGTTGQDRRMEAYSVSSDTAPGESRPTLRYAAYVQDSGWLPNVSWDGIAGTTGQSRRLEAMRCDSPSTGWTCWYRVHVADIGWQGWFSEGQTAGTTGQARPMEAFQMQLLNY